MNDNNEASFETVNVSHEDFRTGLPVGRFRVIVNPTLAPKYVQHRLWLKMLLLPVLGIGIALGISGYLWVGLPMVLVGVMAPRMIRKRAPELLLHLATRDRDIYREAIEYEILEVRARVQG
jgi:exosome complex RNA-binding protein Rrp4